MEIGNGIIRCSTLLIRDLIIHSMTIDQTILVNQSLSTIRSIAATGGIVGSVLMIGIPVREITIERDGSLLSIYCLHRMKICDI